MAEMFRITAKSFMTYYRIPNTRYLRLKANEEIEFDAGFATLLIPQPNSKIYLHWYNGNKLSSTLTLAQPTIVENDLRIINGDSSNTSIQVIKIV